MKVQVKEAEVQQEVKKYPYIGINDKKDNIVLFGSKDNGVVIGGTQYDLGSFVKNWNENKFTPFKGTITLSNE